MDSRCSLCPRACNVSRDISKGFCAQTNEIRLSRAALHFYEEPPISGTAGSGAIFFSGCNLKCVFCQNESIANGNFGQVVSTERLARIMLNLQDQNANNINLVTPSHFVPQIREAIIIAKENGLNIPIVYNSSAYELPETLKLLDGLVDVYLPDFKYYDSSMAFRFSNAKDYPEIAKAAIEEMYRQVKTPVFDDSRSGISNPGAVYSSNSHLIKKGVIVRHLLLPLGVKNAENVISYLHETYGEKIYISVMNQYTPMTDTPTMLKVKDLYPELFRKVTKREYKRLTDFVLSLNVKNAFIQDGDTASDSFIPNFDLTGV